MCGICAVATENNDDKSKSTAKQVFTGLLVGNEARGKDSTGVVAVHTRANRARVIKDTIGASQLVKGKEYKALRGNLFIGHTRYATTGEVNKKNAHPFEYDGLYLVHNGVISNHEELAKEYDMKIEVDSEVILPAVHDRDWDRLGKTRGSINFIAYDKNTKELLVHRKDNPLYYVYIGAYKLHAISSQESILEAVCAVIGDVELFEYTQEEVFMISMTDFVEVSCPIEFEKIAPLPQKQVGYNTQNKYHNYSRYDYDDWDSYDMVCEYCARKVNAYDAEDSLDDYEMVLCPECYDKFNNLDNDTTQDLVNI